MACTGTRGKSGRRPPWTEPDARHGKLGKTTYMAPTRTRTRERPVRGHGKKVPVTRRGLNRTRAMQNWAKQHRSHVRVHGPTTGGPGKREKSGRCSSWTGPDARHGNLGKTTYAAHTRTWTKNGYERSRKKGPIRHGNRFNSS